MADRTEATYRCTLINTVCAVITLVLSLVLAFRQDMRQQPTELAQPAVRHSSMVADSAIDYSSMVGDPEFDYSAAVGEPRGYHYSSDVADPDREPWINGGWGVDARPLPISDKLGDPPAKPSKSSWSYDDYIINDAQSPGETGEATWSISHYLI